MPDFIPRRDVALQLWSGNFAAQLALHAAALEITPQMLADYDQARAAYVEALARTQSTGTRSARDVLDKDQARAELVAQTRALARRVRASPAATPTIRLDMKLTIDRPTTTRVGVPEHAPRVVVTDTRGGRVRVRLFDRSAPENRGRPAGVAGAIIYGHVGPTAPESSEQWRVIGTASRPDRWLVFGGGLPPGTRVWICAAWLNPRLEQGPTSSPPVSAYLAGMELELGQGLKAA